MPPASLLKPLFPKLLVKNSIWNLKSKGHDTILVVDWLFTSSLSMASIQEGYWRMGIRGRDWFKSSRCTPNRFCCHQTTATWAASTHPISCILAEGHGAPEGVLSTDTKRKCRILHCVGSQICQHSWWFSYDWPDSTTEARQARRIWYMEDKLFMQDYRSNIPIWTLKTRLIFYM